MSPVARLSLTVLLATTQLALPNAQGTALRLVDVAAQSGLDLLNVSGGPAKDFIVDANGNGAAFFDYDNDGDLDVLIVNGSTRDRISQWGAWMIGVFWSD